MAIPKDVAAFMERHGVLSDEIWQVHGSTWVIKHKALERAAAAAGIEFDRPAFMETSAEKKIVSMCVFGKLNDRTEWATGEAAPYNNKNQYPYAMAEKRAKDRVILKLLNAHAMLYSEDEADDFKESNKPAQLPKKDAKDIYTKLQREIDEAVSREHLGEWGKANADRIAILPDDWQEILRSRFAERISDLKQREAA